MLSLAHASCLHCLFPDPAHSLLPESLSLRSGAACISHGCCNEVPESQWLQTTWFFILQFCLQCIHWVWIRSGGSGLPLGLQGTICFLAFLPMFRGLCSRAIPAFVSALSSTSDPFSPFYKDPHADRSHWLIQDHLPILGSLITSPWPHEVTGSREQHMGVVRQPYSASHRLACAWCLTPTA